MPTIALTHHAHVLIFIITLLSTVTVLVGVKKKDYIQLGLKTHNEYRSKHKVGDMKLDDSLNEKAEKCAKYYSEKGEIDHSCKFKSEDDDGENIYLMKKPTGQYDPMQVVKRAVTAWYNEINYYNFETGKSISDSQKVGHFTQLVWKDSKFLGIGYFDAGEKGAYVVGLYTPAGNFRNEFKANVFPSIGDLNPKHGSSSSDSESDKSKAASYTSMKNVLVTAVAVNLYCWARYQNLKL